MLSWLTKTPKSNLPEPTALQSLRATQIEQLRHFDSSVTEIQRDVEYRVIINDALSLYIYLPPHFPQDKPLLKVVPPASHTWIDDDMIVTGCYSLNSFVVHSDLGKIVKEVVDEFRRNPPVCLSASSTVSTNTNAGHWSQHGSQLGTLPQQSTPSTVISTGLQQAEMSRPTTDALPYSELKDLSVDEIKEMLSDENKIEDLLSSRIDEVNDVQHKVVLFLEKAANENLAKKTQMDEKKRTVLEKYEQLQEMRNQFEHLHERQDELHSKYDLNLTIDNLKVAALQAEETAESIADKFLNGELSVEEFSQKYMSARKLCHLRRAKEEKLSQNVRQKTRTFFAP